MRVSTAKMAELSVFTAVAFIFSYIESLIPLPIPFPGIKLGLANLVVVIVLYRQGVAAAFGVSMTRNVLNALTFGSVFGFVYSLAGSVLSLIVMAGMRRQIETKKHPRLTRVSVSAVGGIFHNMGQFVVAACLVGTDAIAHYLPFLYFAGLVAGILIGIMASLCLQRLPAPVIHPSSKS